MRMLKTFVLYANVYYSPFLIHIQYKSNKVGLTQNTR